MWTATLTPIVAILVVGALAPATGAQDPDSNERVPSARDSLVRMLEPLETPALVRMRTAADAPIFGRYLRHTEDSLYLSSPSGTLRGFRLAMVDSLWRQSGTHARTGALLGAVGGALLLGGVGYALGGMEGTDCRSCSVMGGAGAGLVLGAGVGCLVGAVFPRWRLAFATY